MNYQLTPWHLWSQNGDATWDGAADENHFNNCGPESCAMCLDYLTGVALPADVIHDAVAGQGFKGYTGFPQLSGFLEQYCSIPTRTYTGDGNTKLRPVVEAALKALHPVIVLFYWNLQAHTGGHFCPVTACSDNGITRANPWGGISEDMSWAAFEDGQQDGCALELLRVRVVATATPGATPPTPPVSATRPPKSWTVTVAQELRTQPALDAPHLYTVSVGQVLGPQTGGIYTPHWSYVAAENQPRAGYLLRSNGTPNY